MLTLRVNGSEMYDEEKNEFYTENSTDLILEHSLLSISKWESKWHKPFLVNDTKSVDEMIDYIRCMTVSKNVNDNVYNCLTDDNIIEINKYVDDPMTATTFSNNNRSTNKEQITSELIYYWMISFNIPWECQKWHINKLLTLIRVCGIKNEPPKKLGQDEIIRRNAELNKARKKQLNSNG